MRNIISKKKFFFFLNQINKCKRKDKRILRKKRNGKDITKDIKSKKNSSMKEVVIEIFLRKKKESMKEILAEVFLMKKNNN